MSIAIETRRTQQVIGLMRVGEKKIFDDAPATLGVNFPRPCRQRTILCKFIFALHRA